LQHFVRKQLDGFLLEARQLHPMMRYYRREKIDRRAAKWATNAVFSRFLNCKKSPASKQSGWTVRVRQQHVQPFNEDVFGKG